MRGTVFVLPHWHRLSVTMPPNRKGSTEHPQPAPPARPPPTHHHNNHNHRTPCSVYLLATHPEKEAKLLAEVDRFGRDRTPAAEDLGVSPGIMDGSNQVKVTRVRSNSQLITPLPPRAWG